MRDNFDEIRAERDHSLRQSQTGNRYAGLWKQIALGIVVGYCALGILSTLGWFIAMHLIAGGIHFNLP